MLQHKADRVTCGLYLSMKEQGDPVWDGNQEKTYRYNVFVNDHPAVVLGEIRWHRQWRTFAFYARPGISFEEKGLLEIAEFLQEAMRAMGASAGVRL